jgi:hypothetical protein
MWRTLPVVLLVGCATKGDLPKQPDAPVTPIVQEVGKVQDKADNRVSAAVAVAKENADKPAVVRAELGVASSYLPAPTEGDLAFARQRASKADQKDYKDAEEYGKKLLAKINTDWAKMEKDQAEAKRVSDLKDAKIKELNAEVERVKKEASANIWSLTGAGLVVVGGLACAFASIRIGIPILLARFFAAAVPHIIDTEWFGWLAGATLLACAGLLVFWLWDKVRDNVNEKPPQEKSDAPQEEDQN